MTRQRDYRGKVYQPGRGVVHIHSVKNQYPAWLTDCVNEQTRIEQHETLPETADYLAYRSRLTATIERTAGRFNAIPVCLPAAADWLRQQLATSTQQQQVNVTVLIYHSDLELPPRKVVPQ